MRAENVAFRTRLAGHTLLAGRVYDAVRYTDAGQVVRDNYVVVKPAMPDRLDDVRYTSRQQAESTRRFTPDVRVVAVDADGLLLFAEAAVEQMVGCSLTVAGRVCDPVELVQGVEEAAQFDSTTRLHYTDLSFRFWSRRGSTPEEEESV